MANQDKELLKIWEGSMASIVEMVAKLDNDFDEARERILEDSLDVSVRSDWTTVGEKMEPIEFKILLGTGGPAVQIVGKLDQHNEPETATLEVQDWGTPWTSFDQTSEQDDALLVYVSQFYFGE